MGIEALIMREDNINNESAAMNAMCLKRGDWIVVKETPCVWGKDEIGMNKFVIMRFADMTIGDGESFLQEEEPITSRAAQPRLKLRVKGLDMDKMTGYIHANQKALDKANWNAIFNHTVAHVQSSTVIKPQAPEILV